MEVRALQNFAGHFADVSDSFVIIGGCACNRWFGEAGLRFRSTMDVDMIVVVEPKNELFFERFWAFAMLGGYNNCIFRKGEGKLFRFERDEENDEFPKQIELLTTYDSLDCPEGIRIIAVEADDPRFDLSAILLDKDYYELAVNSRDVSAKGLTMVPPDVLLLLKVKAYLNNVADRECGIAVKGDDIRKHRNDVYGLTYLLEGHYNGELTETIKSDLKSFLEIFSEDNPEWAAIIQHQKNFGRAPILDASNYNQLIEEYYKIANHP